MRGLAILCIVRTKDVVQALHAIGAKGGVAIIAQQLEHSAWKGFTFYDSLFALFLFVVGISLVFSLDKVIATHGRGFAMRKIFLRVIILFLIGIVYNGGFDWQPIASIRFMGVLQRIALCYGAAGVIYLTCRLKTTVLLCATLLLVYWWLMALAPIQGVGHNGFEEGVNVADCFDELFLPGSRWVEDHDPEGLLSTIPAIASCLLGVFAAALLKKSDDSDLKKVFYFVAIGVSLISIGLCWSIVFPIIKELWTSSYVLLAGGMSFIILGIFYLVIDVYQYRWWAQPFVWVGRNAITVYVASRFVDFMKIARAFVGGDVKDFFNHHLYQGTGDLMVAVVALGITVLLAWFLFTKRVFVTV